MNDTWRTADVDAITRAGHAGRVVPCIAAVEVHQFHYGRTIDERCNVPAPKCEGMSGLAVLKPIGSDRGGQACDEKQQHQ